MVCVKLENMLLFVYVCEQFSAVVLLCLLFNILNFQYVTFFYIKIFALIVIIKCYQGLNLFTYPRSTLLCIMYVCMNVTRIF